MEATTTMIIMRNKENGRNMTAAAAMMADGTKPLLRLTL